jgi:hypothetical protein
MGQNIGHVCGLVNFGMKIADNKNIWSRVQIMVARYIGPFWPYRRSAHFEGYVQFKRSDGPKLPLMDLGLTLTKWAYHFSRLRLELKRSK